jgi:taurine dioxygenase
MRIEALGPCIGAVVSGISLAEPLDDGGRDALLEALLRRHVLFFECQPLTPRQQRDLAARFGELHVYPIYPHVDDVPEIIVLDTSTQNLPHNDNWHTDVTFVQTPPLGALLSAQLLPPSGGDTLWASGIAAYEGLTPRLRALLDG